MLGIGYILAIILLAVDFCFFCDGGWILILISIFSFFCLNGFINKKRLLFYKVQGNTENERKLLRCFERLNNKIINKHQYNFGVSIYIIPGEDANTTVLNWRSIGITEGALRMEPRVIEAVLACEYGRILNGEVFLKNIATVNFLGLFFIFLLNYFAVIAWVYLIVILLFVIGVVRCDLISLFVSERLNTIFRRFCVSVLKGVVYFARFSRDVTSIFGSYIADKYAVRMGYGIYLKRYLVNYATVADSRLVSVLYNQRLKIGKRVARIERWVRNT